MTALLLTIDAWSRAESLAQRFVQWAIVPFIDDIVDVGRWLWRAWYRRKARKPGGHRRGSGTSVWEIFHRMTDEELAQSSWSTERRAPGRHRDRRGWRYAPLTWKQIPLWESEREALEAEAREREHWARVARGLMDEIQYMLDHPPVAETAHGCPDCLCSQISALRQEALV